MRWERSFELPVSVDRSWVALAEVEHVASCLPEVVLTDVDGESFTGRVTVGVGPAAVTFSGGGRFVERDQAGKRIVFVLSGQDSRGAGAFAVRGIAVLHSTRGGAATTVKVVADVDLTGRAAELVHTVFTDVSSGGVQRFADRLALTIPATMIPATTIAASTIAATTIAATTIPATTIGAIPDPACAPRAEFMADPVPVVPVVEIDAPGVKPVPAKPVSAKPVSAKPMAAKYHPLAMEPLDVAVDEVVSPIAGSLATASLGTAPTVAMPIIAARPGAGPSRPVPSLERVAVSDVPGPLGQPSAKRWAPYLVLLAIVLIGLIGWWAAR